MVSWALTTEIALCAPDCSAPEHSMSLRWHYMLRCLDRHWIGMQAGQLSRCFRLYCIQCTHRGTSGGGSVTCRGDGGVQLLLGTGLEFGYDYAYTLAWVAVVEYQARSHQPSALRRLRGASVVLRWVMLPAF